VHVVTDTDKYDCVICTH